jgi:hypothetical protein
MKTLWGACTHGLTNYRKNHSSNKQLVIYYGTTIMYSACAVH